MKRIQVFGSGCPRCAQLAQNVEAAAKEMGVEFTLEKVTDFQQMMQMGVLSTPALAVDGEVKATGRLLSPADIKKLLA